MSQPQDKRFVTESRVDSLVANKLRDPTSTTRLELAPVVKAQADSSATAALANNATVVNAAQQAASNAATGLKLPVLTETFEVDEAVFAITDGSGSKTSIEVAADGRPTARFAKDMSDVGKFMGGVPTYDSTIALTDASGNIIPDAQWDQDTGYFVPAVVDRLKPQLDQRTQFKIPRMFQRLPSATDTKLVQANLNAVKYMLNGFIPTRFPGTGAITTMGGSGQDEIRHPGAAVFAIATAIYTNIYDPAIVGMTVADAKTSILRVITGAVNQHATVVGTATGWGTDGTRWVWQDMAWAQMYAAAAWMIKGDVDPALWTKIKTMMAAESNTLLNLTPTPPTQYNMNGVDTEQGGLGNSHSEENAWMAGAVSFASTIYPEHTNRANWDAWVLNWMACAGTRPSDATMGRTIQGIELSSFNGWNVLETGVIINHNIIHPDYMCAMAELAWSAGVLRVFNNQTIPASFMQSGEYVYRALSDVLINGRTIYTPGTGTIYYPQGTDWGTGRYADKAMADVLAHCMGVDSLTTVPAATWADLHLQTCLDMQNRFTDGHTYLSSAEDGYVGREPWVARNLALAMLAARIPLTARYNYK